MIIFILLAFAAYLLGSISSAVLVSRILGLPDPRTLGSKNPGTTNVLRIGGKKAAGLTFLGDFMKGWVVTYTASKFGFQDAAVLCLGCAACLGHLYPILFRFQGGKGVATAFGVFAGFSPVLACFMLITWLFFVLIFRIVSLASLCTSLLPPLYFLSSQHQGLLPVLLMTVLVWYKHKSNMVRLISGIEPRLDR